MTSDSSEHTQTKLSNEITYENAGVNIAAGDALIDRKSVV